jgi:hypothetical protein
MYENSSKFLYIPLILEFVIYKGYPGAFGIKVNQKQNRRNAQVTDHPQRSAVVDG